MADPPFKLARNSGAPTLDNLKPIELIDIGIAHIWETTKAQWVDFKNQKMLDLLERRTFDRYLIADAAWGFGLYRYGDDINLYFVTSDPEWRWAEVVAEAMGIEMGKGGPEEARRDCKMDLTDEKFCHFKDGRRTQYWHLKNSNPANSKIVLHYVRIEQSWLGGANLRELLQNTEDGCIITVAKDNLTCMMYEHNLHQLDFLKFMTNKSTGNPYDYVVKVWPWARAWAELHNIWRPALVDPQTLWAALMDVYLIQGVNDDTELEEEMFIYTLRTWATSLKILRHVPKHRTKAIFNTAVATLCDVGMLYPIRMATVALTFNERRDRLLPLAPSERPLPAEPSIAGEPGTRFRDARNAINRLRHDIAHVNVQYDVGYMDRFEGMKFMPLEKWGRKQTEDDDFVPEHRVRQIVRVNDATIVWDREKRIDLTGDA